MAAVVFNRAKKEILDGTIDLVNDTIKAMLVTSAYTPNADDDFVNGGAAAAELSGTGYVAGFAGSGRKTLASKAFSEDDPNDRGEFIAANLTWTAVNAGTAAAVVIYKHLTSDAASVIIAYIDTGGFPKVTNGGDLSITWNAEGILQLT